MSAYGLVSSLGVKLPGATHQANNGRYTRRVLQCIGRPQFCSVTSNSMTSSCAGANPIDSRIGSQPGAEQMLENPGSPTMSLRPVVTRTRIGLDRWVEFPIRKNIRGMKIELLLQP